MPKPVAPKLSAVLREARERHPSLTRETLAIMFVASESTAGRIFEGQFDERAGEFAHAMAYAVEHGMEDVAEGIGRALVEGTGFTLLRSCVAATDANGDGRIDAADATIELSDLLGDLASLLRDTLGGGRMLSEQQGAEMSAKVGAAMEGLQRVGAIISRSTLRRTA